MKRTIKALLLGIAVGCAAAYAGLWGLYAWLLPPAADLPRPPVDLQTPPPLVADALWASFGYREQPRLKAMGPLRWLALFACHARVRDRAGHHACDQSAPGLLQASRIASHHAYDTGLGRGNLHFMRAAMALWVTRHWTAEQMVAWLAAEAYFTPRAAGVDDAARLMFGKDSESLSAHEAALLATGHRRPASLIPWCDRPRASDEARAILRRMADAGVITHEILERELATPPKLQPLPAAVGECRDRPW